MTTFNLLETDPGSGGAKLPSSQWTQGADTVRLPLSGLMFGVIDTENVVVSATNPLPVVQTGALPAGTNGIGKLTSNSGVVIGSVEIAAAQTIAVTNAGTFAVQAACTNAGTFVVQENGGVLTSLQLIDDTVVTLGTTTYTEAASKGLAIGAVRRDADTTLVDTTNEFGPLQMDANGRLKVEAFSGETLPVSLTSTTVTGTVAVTQSGTWDEVGINDSGNSITVDAPVDAPTFVRLSDGAAAITTLPVSVSGVSTAANQATIIGHVDGIEGLLTTIDADTSNLSVVGGGTEAAAIRVTIASDSTGVVSIDDNGGAITVDGTVAVSGSVAVTGTFWQATQPISAVSLPSHDVTNAGAFAVQSTSVIPGTGATNLGKAIDTATGATDTGVLLLATRDDALAALTPIEGDNVQLRTDANGALWTTVSGTVTVGSHAVTNAGTFPVQVDGAALTSLQLLDDAVSGAGFNITQLNGVNVSMGNGASGTGVQRVTLANDSTGVVSLTTSTASIGKLATNAGVTIGAVEIAASQTVAVTNTGTFAVQATLAAGATNIAKAEDAASAGADVGVPAMAVQTATPANTAGTDGDYEFLQMSAGRLWCSTTVDTALPAGTNAIGKLAANSGVDIGDVDITSIAAGDNNIGNVDIVTVPADPFGADADAASATGSISAKLRFIASTGIPITGTVTVGSHDIGTVTTVTTCATVTTVTGSSIAHDSADSGNPHKVGAKATASVLGETPVAAADRTNLFAGTDGVLLGRPHTSLEDIISERTTNTDGASTAMTGAFAATASQRIYLTTLILSNSSATACEVDIRDGSAGAVLITVPVPATGGAVLNFPVPLRFSANTPLAFDASAATTTIAISVIGFKSKT